MAKKIKVVEPKEKYADKNPPDWRVLDGYIPTRKFEIGEPVRYGSHESAVVEKIFYHNDYPVQYGLYISGNRSQYGKQVPYTSYQVVDWNDIYKIGCQKETNFSKDVLFDIRYSNYDINGLISKVLSEYAGVDFSPSYQREYVWNDSDKEALIDSIFNNIGIGLFLFAKLPFTPNGKGYEIIDGKQRLTTLVDFWEDRFQYKGYYFSELSFMDKLKFEHTQVTYGEMNQPTEKQKLAAFISVNTTGKVMDSQHLQKIIDKFNELQ